jgi:hypothetical protein
MNVNMKKVCVAGNILLGVWPLCVGVCVCVCVCVCVWYEENKYSLQINVIFKVKLFD